MDVAALTNAILALLASFKASVLGKAFHEQRKLILDPSRWKAALTTRRAAKSTAGALALIDAALSKGDGIYISLSRPQIRRDFWVPILIPLLEELKIRFEANETMMYVHLLDSNHYIYTFPVDANETEKRKLRGGKCALIVIDECQDIRIDLADLITSILGPKLADLKGSMILLGTPGKIMKGLWFRITQGSTTDPDEAKIPGWSVHMWSATQNPHIKWAEEIEEIKKQNPGIERTAKFRREYLGEWVADDEDHVVHYAEPFNCFYQLPEYAAGGWHYLAGLDLGWDHPTAIVIGAYHDHDHTLYVLESYSQSHLRPSQVATIIQQYMLEYEFEEIIVDPASAQVIAEIEERLGFRMVPAQKKGRDEFIELLDDDFQLGRVKVNPLKCTTLVGELKTLLKDMEDGDDNFDALLYMWRRATNFIAIKPPDKKVLPGTPEYLKIEADRMREAARQEVVAKEEREKQMVSDIGFNPNDQLSQAIFNG